MSERFPFPVGLAVASMVLAASACGGSSASPEPAAESTAEPAAAADSSTDGLILDYTAFLDGAVQPSGVAVSPDGSTAAIVTDFELVVLVDLATQEPTAQFDVGRHDLPQQGATEAVAFIDDDRLAVLDQDDGVIGVFDLDGKPLEEIVVDTDVELDGALAVVDGRFVVSSRSADGAHLLLVDPDGSTAEMVELAGAPDPFEGLSPTATDGQLIAVTRARELFRVDVATGDLEMAGHVAEVADPSGLELIEGGPDGETHVAVSDDDDAYNAEPSPLRLYLP